MSSGLVDPNDPPLPEVERRAAVLRDLLRQSGWKVTAEVADTARRNSEFHDQRCFAQLLAFVGRVGLRAFFRSSAEREMGVCYLIRGSNASSKSK
jgi:hypothetical protein